MKILLFCVLSFSFMAHAGVSIVSDLDDTIKITNSDNPVEATINGFFNTKTYAGVPEFLKAARTYTNKLFVISASPGFLRPKIEELIEKNNLQVDGLILRESFSQSDSYKYKVAEIKKIMEQSSDDFIFLGDDVERDSLVYEEVKRTYPNRVLAIYIHTIHNRPVTNSAQRYWTSFDLTLSEVVANRMDPSALTESLNAIMAQKDMTMIFPKFATCPKVQTVWEWQLATLYREEAQKVINRLVTYCSARSFEILAKTE